MPLSLLFDFDNYLEKAKTITVIINKHNKRAHPVTELLFTSWVNCTTIWVVFGNNLFKKFQNITITLCLYRTGICGLTFWTFAQKLAF